MNSQFLLQGLARGFALFLGGFSLLNVLGELRRTGFDANIWWIDLRPIPSVASRAFLLVAAALLITYFVRPDMSNWRRRVTIGLSLALLVVTLWNGVGFYLALARGDIRAGVPVPLSFLVSLLLGVTLFSMARAKDTKDGAWAKSVAAGVAAICMVGFPAAQMFCYGKTDYRRPADAAVVFGARAYVDGQPSLALADRVRTGCELYQEGLIRRLVFSGGPGDGDFHETEVMRRMAMDLGVPDQDILVDTDGLNTQATVRNTVPVFEALGVGKVLAVSHFYHLPRIKMAYERAGCTVYTVPAAESRTLVMLPYFLAREVAALWVYYLRPLRGQT